MLLEEIEKIQEKTQDRMKKILNEDQWRDYKMLCEPDDSVGALGLGHRGTRRYKEVAVDNSRQRRDQVSCHLRFDHIAKNAGIKRRTYEIGVVMDGQENGLDL